MPLEPRARPGGRLPDGQAPRQGGGARKQCDRCGHRRVWYNSCRNRHCPTCQSLARAAWLERCRADLLPTEYFHVVFTVPPAVAEVAIQNKAVVYGLLFRTVAETLRTIAADPRHLGAEISCGGLSDETELRGHNRTWTGAQPGRIVRGLVGIGVKNPVLVFDEIDKMQRTARSAGDPESTLLEVLDPVQHDRFADHYVEVPFDGGVLHRHRLEVIELPGYAEDEKRKG